MAGTVGEDLVRGLLEISVQAAVIFCVLVLVRAFFALCRAPKKYACLLWLILFVRLLMPIQPESPVGLWTKGGMQYVLVENRGEYSDQTLAGDGVSASAGAQSAENAGAWKERPESINIGMPMGSQGEQQGTGSMSAPKALYRGKGIWMPLFAVWGTGCLGCLLYGGISCLRLKRKLRCSIKQKDNCYLADGIPTAFVMGIFSPKIYLPSELGEKDMAYVILHERMHIKRRDHLAKMAAYLITCAYWFHPLVWVALFFMSRDIELSCDEAVLRVLGEDSRCAYADTLLRLSEGRSCLAGAPIAFGEGDTQSRIRHIVRYRKPMAAAAALAVILLSGLAVCLLTGRPSEDGDKGGIPAEMLSEESGESSDSGVILSAESNGNREPASADGDPIQPAAAQEDNRSIGENAPDSINSRFPGPVELSSGHIVTVTGDVYNITIAIDGEAYRMTDLCDQVNALESIREFGEYIVVEGHISPDSAYYGFYSTRSGQWEWEYTGSLLTWDENWKALDNPVESVIYAGTVGSQGVIYDWKMNMIAVFDLEEEYIYGLKREGDDIAITIAGYEGGSRELHFDHKDSFHTLFHWR
ncbi:MAG: hypothetical protein NC420_02310 [Eubacterium sp.]|nr:hypothetical protein [Eubacterium sp.]MCM1214842.1 hypothetical protein [Lachnospiraceae bacterium]MCM1303469.1 hypothetical protein [Butyrivibrio sp.]MCM1342767.1 hypothetical protein [Muribaculaceae bacterium]MCM1238918.1 hypothetical protein [Lachnospiraceae bacterium]